MMSPCRKCLDETSTSAPQMSSLPELPWGSCDGQRPQCFLFVSFPAISQLSLSLSFSVALCRCQTPLQPDWVASADGKELALWGYLVVFAFTVDGGLAAEPADLTHRLI